MPGGTAPLILVTPWVFALWLESLFALVLRLALVEGRQEIEKNAKASRFTDLRIMVYSNALTFYF